MKRSRILPIETPDRPRSPGRLVPMHRDPRWRAGACYLLGPALLVLWLGVATAIGGGVWPW
jgi:hypothetical protein